MLSKGDESTWNTMLQRYMTESNAQEKTKLLKGLAWLGSGVTSPVDILSGGERKVRQELAGYLQAAQSASFLE